MNLLTLNWILQVIFSWSPVVMYKLFVHCVLKWIPTRREDHNLFTVWFSSIATNYPPWFDLKTKILNCIFRNVKITKWNNSNYGTIKYVSYYSILLRILSLLIVFTGFTLLNYLKLNNYKQYEYYNYQLIFF